MQVPMKQIKIYIDRLKQDHTLKLDEAIPPDFMQIEEEGLAFEGSIHVQGEAYLVDDHLVIHLNLKSVATLPCSICNYLYRGLYRSESGFSATIRIHFGI